MHKRTGIAAVVLVLAGVGYWWLASDTHPELDLSRLAAPHSFAKNDGDAESSDAIEPLVVDRAARGLAALPETRSAHMEALPRVVLAPGMTQPPRPDADSGETRRMPYADEDDKYAPYREIIDLINKTSGAGSNLLLQGRRSQPSIQSP